MRTSKRSEDTTGTDEIGGLAWREEVQGYAFEIYLGVSRLMAAVQIAPPKAPSPRNKRLGRRQI